MLFQLFAFSIVVSFVSFAFGYLCRVWVTSPLESLFFLIGTFFMIQSYATVCLAFLCYCIKSIHTHASKYFAKTATLERKMLFSQNKKNNLQRLYHFEKQQLHYRNEQLRHYLLRANHRKHLRPLAKSLDHNLNQVRDKIPRPDYRSCKQDIANHYRAENIEGLMTLHCKIKTIR